MRTFFHALSRKSRIIRNMSIKAGNLLRKAREAKGVSLKEASDALHIRLPYLQALEGGRTEIIPSAVQARGFLRIYAEYLDLDTAMIIKEWDNPSADESEAPAEPAAEPEKKASAKPRFNPFAKRTASTEQPSAQPVQQPAQPVQQPYIPTGTAQPIPQQPIRQPYIPTQNNGQQVPPIRQQPVQQPYAPQQPVTNFVPRQQTSGPETPVQPVEKKEKKAKKPFSLFGRKKDESASSAPEEKTPQEIFKEIGAKLAFRRKALSLSVEDCESQTLIRSIYIESMEQGNFEQLPSFMQARGMLNNYAAFLDLDVDNIMLEFATALQEYTLEKNNRPAGKKHKPAKRAGKLKSFFTPDLFVGVFVIVGIAGIIIYSAITITAYRRSVTEPTAAFNLLDQYQNTTHTPFVLETETPTPNPEELQMLLAGTETANEAEESEEETEVSPVRIFVTANQRTYMKVTADGKEVFAGRTVPGNTYPFDAENLIELTTGNAAALSVTYNQQNLGTLGTLGQIVTIDFSPLLAATPTPQFSPTPTNTYEPTYTSMPETPLPTNTPTPYIP